MNVKTMWGLRKGERYPELMEAWDYYSMDSNPGGFEEACKKSRKEMGDDLLEFRIIDLGVSMDSIDAAFATTTVAAEVVK